MDSFQCLHPRRHKISNIKVILFDIGGTACKSHQKDTMIDMQRLGTLNRETAQEMVNPGIFELLDILKEAGFCLGILSNTSKFKKDLDPVYISALKMPFSFSVFSSELEFQPKKEGDPIRKKPHPDIFHAAYSRAKVFVPDLKYEEVLMVGNNFKKDFLGAQAVGMKAIWFECFEPAKMPSEGDIVTSISTMMDLLRYIDMEE
ncbi:Haloacid dehalogenase-like hydrolase like protein [Aduncisulcus paluster]|uniref:Haloacid dehalogenase-like hydrolase like protein n=1 Tax=Aduncisulcus paluster TaxID=2918883 RepID=A0ABQ5KR83_9EUKA|nr:Haloacid dehalogenase-like hydrolase like protein [Aduncisulcus paluster]